MNLSHASIPRFRCRLTVMGATKPGQEGEWQGQITRLVILRVCSKCAQSVLNTGPFPPDHTRNSQKNPQKRKDRSTGRIFRSNITQSRPGCHTRRLCCGERNRKKWKKFFPFLPTFFHELINQFTSQASFND